MNSEWFIDFFEGMALELWKKACPEQQTCIEIDLVERLLELSTGDKILDVPCGFGRHALNLASKDYSVTAVDLAKETTRELARTVKKSDLPITVIRTDMRFLKFENQFDAAYCLGNSFGYFNRQDTDRFIKSVARSLKNGARFLLETGVAAESLLPNLDERNWVQVDDILMLIENDYRVEESCLQTTYTFIKENRQHTSISYHFVYSVGEISDFLKNNGLEPQNYYNGADLEHFEVGSNDLFIVAEKVGAGRK
jgi:SAM-dependent methyltransferase